MTSSLRPSTKSLSSNSMTSAWIRSWAPIAPAMIERTHIPESRWWVLEGVDKKRSRLNCIHHLLQQVPYQEVPHDPIMLPDREHKPDYSRHPVPPDLYVPAVY